MTYLPQRDDFPTESELPNQNPSRHSSPRQNPSSRRFGCVLCRTGSNAPAILRPLPEPLHSVLYPHPRVCGFLAETHSFLHRTAIQYKRRFAAYFLFGLPPSVAVEEGHHQQSNRGYSCTEDMRNYVNAHPWATILDLETYRDAWLAGARWGESNSCKTNMAVGSASEDSINER